MIALEIRDCSQHALDMITSAGRFQQIIAIVEFARSEGYSSVQRILAENGPTVIGSITRLLRTPHLRWEPDNQGRRVGTYFDTVFEHRLIHMGRLASSLEFILLRTLFKKNSVSWLRVTKKGGLDIWSARR